jgi:hypothetical protein
MDLETRLKGLPLPIRSKIAAAQNARIRSDEAHERSDEMRADLVRRVRGLLDDGVPAMTLAMALRVSKTWVIRCRPSPADQISKP